MEEFSSGEVHEGVCKCLSRNESCSQIRVKNDEFQDGIDFQNYLPDKIIEANVDEVVKYEATSGHQIKTEIDAVDFHLKWTSINYDQSGNIEFDSKDELKSELSLVKDKGMDEVMGTQSFDNKIQASSNNVIFFDFIKSNESPGKRGGNIKLSCSACNSTITKGFSIDQLLRHIKKVHAKDKNIIFKCNYCSEFIHNKKVIIKHFHKCAIQFKRNHFKLKIVKCELCNVKTSNLDKHYKKVHIFAYNIYMASKIK